MVSTNAGRVSAVAGALRLFLILASLLSRLSA